MSPCPTAIIVYTWRTHPRLASEQIDQITSGVIALLEVHFPDRISGYYFEGSCAERAITPLSDIDLAVVFKGRQATTE